MTWVLAAGVVAVLAVGPALASGFSLYEQSAKASGLAGAWVARADDAAAAWYNPAAMVHQKGMQFQFGINYIDIGGGTSFTYNSPIASPFNGMKFDAESNLATPFHLYFTQNINDRIAWGVAVTTPFGLVTEWKDIPVTLSARKSDLATFVVNPSVAFRFNDNWSGAIGVDYMYADVRDFSRDLDISALFEAPPLAVIAGTNLTGTGDAWGWNVALHYASDAWNFGLTYRGELSPEIDGDVEFFDIPAPVAAFFPNGPGKATLDLPAEAAAGVSFKVTDAWTMEFDLAWAGWSSFKELVLDFTNETPAVQDVVLTENWDDTFSYRFGAAWKVADQHEVRFGAVFDESPVPKENLRPSIPDSNRTGLTVGYGYIGPKWDFDAYLMPLWFDEITATPGETGVLPGKYKSFVYLLGATVNFRF